MKPVSEFTDDELRGEVAGVWADRHGRALAAEVLRLRERDLDWKTTVACMDEELAHARRVAVQAQAEVLRLRGVDQESLRTIENLNARAEKAEADLAAARGDRQRFVDTNDPQRGGAE